MYFYYIYVYNFCIEFTYHPNLILLILLSREYNSC